MAKRKTNEQFLQDLKLVNDTIIPKELYVNAVTKIECYCVKCGYTWPVSPNSLLKGSGCPKCAGNIQKSNSQFLIEMSQINPIIELLEEYKGLTKEVMCRCKVCGCEWPAKPKYLLKNKYSCPLCSPQKRGENRRKTNDEFISELTKSNPDIMPLEPYITSSKSIRCQCKRCGYTWSATPNNLLSKGSGCPKCNNTSTSIVEQIIAKSFSAALGNDKVLSRDRKAIKKELDVYIPCLQLALEFGAWFWHKDKIEKDLEKQKLCKEKGIHVITIFERYDSPKEYVLSGDFRIYKENLSGERDFHSIKEILKSIFKELGISFLTIEDEWGDIVNRAIEETRIRDEKTFVSMLHKVNPAICLIGKYTKSDERVQCKCTICGHEWAPLASSLLGGHGCPKCATFQNAKKRTMTNEEFLSKLSVINKDIEPLEPYVKSNINILCRCKKCGNTWSVRPANLLSGKGCRKCARATITEHQSKPIRCVETGICYSSIAEVTRMGVFNVIKCLKGRQETAGGYHWEYVEKQDV